jgi:trans-aconitate methyltransferase
MTLTEDFWTKYWRNKTDPDHSASDEDYYNLMAAELLVLLGQTRFDSVFEIGCGNGAFYQRLGFDRTQYTGIDFSPAMLSVFREKYPGVRVETADARTYAPREPVDLVFSNGVLQNFSSADIERHLEAIRPALKPGGQILHAAVPWNLLRYAFFSGAIHGRKRSRLRLLASYLAARAGLRPALGYWYSVDRIRSLADKHGLDTTFYGSLLYPYRFSVRMVPRAR